MKTILVTGGCGFIASNFTKLLLSTKNYIVINIDKMSYCSNIKNITYSYNYELHKIENTILNNYYFYQINMGNREEMYDILIKHNVNIVYNFAAQTHVDNSFDSSIEFVEDNILSTTKLLETCRKYGKLEKFIHVSTDEVYGQITKDKIDVVMKYGLLDPTNPYAATKAAAELMVKSFGISYGLPIIITRSNNVYGQCQYWEKIIPKFIRNVLNGQKCPVYGDGQACRKYLHISDACEAYLLIMEKGSIGNIYEMGSDSEFKAIDITHKIIKQIKPNDNVDDWINYVEDRKFHDQHYIVNMKLLLELGWKEKISFEEGFTKTIEWYTNFAVPENYWSN